MFWESDMLNDKYLTVR